MGDNVFTAFEVSTLRAWEVLCLNYLTFNMTQSKIIIFIIFLGISSIDAEWFTNCVVDTKDIRICKQGTRNVVTAHSEIECVLSCKVLGIMASSFYPDSVLCICFSVFEEACIRDQLQTIKTTRCVGGSYNVKNMMMTLKKEAVNITTRLIFAKRKFRIKICKWINICYSF